MRLTCIDFHLNKEVGFAVSSCIVMSSFTLVVLSYVGIVSVVVRIPSVEGRGKAFSTCSSHLTMVVLVYGTGSFKYLSKTVLSPRKIWLCELMPVRGVRNYLGNICPPPLSLPLSLMNRPVAGMQEMQEVSPSLQSCFPSR